VEQINIASLAKHFSDEASAWEFMENLRWPNGPVCPHCQHDRAYFIKARSGERTTSTGRTSYRRLWKCASCRKQFSVLVGSIFEDSKVPLAKWLLAVYMMCSDKNGVAAFELHRTLGVTNKTAWFMLHRIREAMANRGRLWKMHGTVVADETFVGGLNKNRHERKQADAPAKAIVLTLIDKERGQSRSRVIPDVTGRTLKREMQRHVHPAAVLHTDSNPAYNGMGRMLSEHHTVNHKAGEYVRHGKITTNQAENFFSQFKRSLDGTHHHVSVEHLQRYASEFDFRYSTRDLTDSQRMHRLMGQTGGVRLTYSGVCS
jgi:transposase-like protein